VAFIATGQSYPDALAGGPAAAKEGGPLLLVQSNAIPPATASELTRLQPAAIVILGGTGVVSAAVATALDAYTTGTVTRRSGSDRYATAAAISAGSFDPGVTSVFVATGEGFADALAGGPAAAKAGAPLLLVRGFIPNATATELQRLGPTSIVILGGTGVVSTNVGTGLGAYTED
jgi:putative cell wall-binding protein